VDDIITSGGRHPERAAFATHKIRDMAATLCERLNALFRDIAIELRPEMINEGFRLEWAKYGAKNSWHKRGGAVDLTDPGNLIGKMITRSVLLKHLMRREDFDYTSTWCHLDIGEPYGVVFRP
jgi:hypothetical protein